MIAPDDYQWRYRRPARPLHALFAERTPVAMRARRRQLRRLGLLVLIGVSLAGHAALVANVASSNGFLVSNARALIQDTASLLAWLRQPDRDDAHSSAATSDGPAQGSWARTRQS